MNRTGTPANAPRRHWTHLLWVWTLLSAASLAAAQTEVPWTALSASEHRSPAGSSWTDDIPGARYRLDVDALALSLDQAVQAPLKRKSSETETITVPMPDGDMARFVVEEAGTLHPDLAARYPDIRTYRGRGVDDPLAIGHFDVTSRGFHGQILSPRGAAYIDPIDRDRRTHYVSYWKRSYRGAAGGVDLRRQGFNRRGGSVVAGQTGSHHRGDGADVSIGLGLYRRVRRVPWRADRGCLGRDGDDSTPGERHLRK